MRPLIPTLLILTLPILGQQPENTVDCTTPEPIALSYGDHTSGCTLSPATDLDTFVFLGTSGETIRLMLRSTTKYADPHVEIYDPTGLEVFDKVCSGSSTGGCSLMIEYTLLATGNFSVFITDSGVNDTFNYNLQLERLPPAIPMPGIPYNTTVSDVISPPTDLDFWLFEGTTGTTVRILVQSTTKYADPYIELFAPSGTKVNSKICSGSSTGGCSISWDETLAESGTYVLVLRDSGLNDTISYKVSINCLFGQCPVSPSGLTTDATSVSASVGGAVNFTLDAGPSYAADTYFLFGSSNGFSPGVPFGPVLIPLNLDAWYALFSISHANLAPFVNTLGFLDGAGQGSASLVLPPGTDPALAGMTLHHAFIGFDPVAGAVEYASNPVALSVLP